MKNQYKLITEKCYSSIINLDCLKINGFHFKPSNNIKYNGITVTKMTLVNYSFVEKVLKRKIKKRLEVYLRFIMTLVDDNDDTDINAFTSRQSIIKMCHFWSYYRNYL